MKPGRNDACPCGSGKKYKKCCWGKAPAVPVVTAAEAAPSPTTIPVNEPRFYPVVTSCCTQGALEEALKPGGMVYIHPYVLIKLRDDPRLFESVGPNERAGLLHSWRALTLAAMATEQIEGRVVQMGIPYDPARLAELTRAEASAWSVGERWADGLPSPSRADRDFLGLAACELWRRRFPEHPSLEMIDDWICEGYAFSAQKKPTAALESWWKVWEALRPRLTPEMKNLGQAAEKLFSHMSQFLGNWGVDFRIEAINGALQDRHCGELGIRFIREVLERLPESDSDLNFSGDLGMLLFAVGCDAEGEQWCQRLIQDYPDRAVGYVIISEELLRRFRKGEAGQDQLERGIQLLEQALAYPVKDPRDYDVESRLADARAMRRQPS